MQRLDPVRIGLARRAGAARSALRAEAAPADHGQPAIGDFRRIARPCTARLFALALLAAGARPRRMAQGRLGGPLQRVRSPAFRSARAPGSSTSPTTHFTAAASGSTTGLLRVFTSGQGTGAARGTLVGGQPVPSTYAATIIYQQQNRRSPHDARRAATSRTSRSSRRRRRSRSRPGHRRASPAASSIR